MDFHKLMPKEEKDLQSLLIAEKLFTHVSRSKTAGSISLVQRGLLEKKAFEISKRRFCMEACAESKKKQSGGLFSRTLTPHLVAGQSPCSLPRASAMAEIPAAPFGQWGTVDVQQFAQLFSAGGSLFFLTEVFCH